MTIKYRVWDRAYRKMFYPCDDKEYLLRSDGVVVESGEDWVGGDEGSYRVDTMETTETATPMLFSGKTDVTGKEVFDGDYLSHPEPKVISLFEVKTRIGRHGLEFYLHNKIDGSAKDFFPDISELKVVGNRYETSL